MEYSPLLMDLGIVIALSLIAIPITILITELRDMEKFRERITNSRAL